MLLPWQFAPRVPNGGNKRQRHATNERLKERVRAVERCDAVLVTAAMASRNAALAVKARTVWDLFSNLKASFGILERRKQAWQSAFAGIGANPREKGYGGGRGFFTREY